MKLKHISSKYKTLHVMKFFIENTDEEHPANAKDVIKYLESLGLRGERKAIYQDILVLNEFGIKILKKNHGFYYNGQEK